MLSARDNDINWTSNRTSGHVTIMYTDGMGNYMIASNVPDNGSYPWTIPKYLATNLYTIFVEDASNASLVGPSDWFNINGLNDYIVVWSPSSTANWTANSTHSIQWVSKGTSGQVNIEYYNGSTYHVIANNVADTGSYSWTVPSSISSGYYQIYICDSNNASISALSSSFYVTHPSPSQSPGSSSTPGFDVTFTMLGLLIGTLGIVAITLKKQHLHA
ncbi:MAG TPA: Ser-Thr-rich GPI-anchored membrane family protein [Candidatus Lokiarchaeia archaeon]|nr:Ser-Thr-rich GPI-anchored membrane family protein [Candidatus Lokiarchaeia archaeon]